MRLKDVDINFLFELAQETMGSVCDGCVYFARYPDRPDEPGGDECSCTDPKECRRVIETIDRLMDESK